MSDFFAEQDARMNMPDEHFGDYVARMATTMNRDIRVPESTCKIHTPERAQGDLERAVSIEGNKVEASLNGTVNEDTSRLKRRQVEITDTDISIKKKYKRHKNTLPVATDKLGIRVPPAQTQNNAKNAIVDGSIPESHEHLLSIAASKHEYHARMDNRPSEPNPLSEPASSVTFQVPENDQKRHQELLGSPEDNSLLKAIEISKNFDTPSITQQRDILGTGAERGTAPPPPLLSRSKSTFAPQATSTQYVTTPKIQSASKVSNYSQPIKPSSESILAKESATLRMQQASPSMLVSHSASKGAAAPSNTKKITTTPTTSAHLAPNFHEGAYNDVDLAPTISRHSSGTTARTLSEFVPQVTHMQLPAILTDSGSGVVQTKVSNFSSSKRGPKRGQVLKLIPKTKLDVDTSSITNPGAATVQPSLPSIENVPHTDTLPSVPLRAGCSKTKSSLAVVRGKKLAPTGKKKEKQLITPLAYAQTLCTKLGVLPKKANFLKGKRIFYTGGDMQYASQSTRKRMELIIQNGGTLIPSYDPELVTHIITDATERPTLRALELKSLKEIAPTIPVVTWDWVARGRGRTGLNELEHSAFVSHMVETLPEKGKVRSKVDNDSSGEISRISEFTQDNPQRASVASRFALGRTTPPISAQGRSLSRNINVHGPEDEINSTFALEPARKDEVYDPLAEFYTLAKAEQDNGCTEDENDPATVNQEESDDEEISGNFREDAGPPVRRGYTCDSKVIQLERSKNQDIVEKLQQLMELHKSKPSKDDFWRGFSYTKSLRHILNHPRRIRSYAEARSIRGVGHKTAQKIMEIIETGGLRRIAFESTEDVEAAKIFTGIYGVGQTIAYRWYANGCRTLDDVRMGKGGVKLTPVMEIGLRFYDDINSRMPRAEASEIFNLIKPIALQLDPRLFIEIMGSFRRGKQDCGDIDIMITRPTDDGKTHAGVFPRLLLALHEAGIITEDLALPDDSHSLEATYRGLCKLPDSVDSDGRIVRRVRRRIDILSIPWESRGAALLYYTGDDIFNRAMRFKANKMGYSLNQRGLFQGVVRDPKDRRIKTNAGSVIASETEEEIFEILGVPWQEPHERIRSG